MADSNLLVKTPFWGAYPVDVAAPEQPRGVRRLDFTALSDDDFELLCYLTVLTESPDAVRLRAPDLGADSALPGSDGGAYVRCWQAKRFTGHIHWAQCQDSLTAAVSAYKMPHYTFCFARDLTGAQHAIFKQRLGERDDGVNVDYWGAARLTSALLSSPQGERIANHFFEDPAQNTRALMQALRAGGALETGADAAERLRGIAEWLATHDPFFSYAASVREAHIPSPGITPGAVIAFEEIGPEVAHRFEAVPRNPEAVKQFGPEFTLLFEQTKEGRAALAAFQRSFETGKQVTLDQGVGLRFDRMPPLLQSHVSAEPLEGMSITLGPSEPARPARWPARLVTRSDRGEGEIEIDLEPVEPPMGWHGALEGFHGGLTATLLFRRVQDRGEAKFTFNFSYDSTLPVAAQLAASATIVALHGEGRMEIEARDGSRPSMGFDLVRQELQPFFPALHRILQDLRVIEERAATTFSLPDSIDGEEMSAIAEVAYILRHGHSNMNFEQITVDLDDVQYAAFKAGTQGPLRLVLPLQVNLFGEEMSLGYLTGQIEPEDIRIARSTPIEGAEPSAWTVRLEPVNERARKPVFQLQRDEPEFAVAARAEAPQ